MSNQIKLVWPPETAGPELQLAGHLGRKAVGLMRIPAAWRPPFFVLPASVFSEWKNAEAKTRGKILDTTSSAVIEATRQFGGEWVAGLILRSSAVNESLADRGTYDSKPIPADYGVEAIKRALEDIFCHFIGMAGDDRLAVVVQPLVPGPNRFLGHISNERRVSKTVNQWMLESLSGDWIERFNSQRAATPDPNKGLSAENAKKMIAVLRSVGRWCTQLNKGPAHIEWAWSNARLWLLQLDFEDDSPDDGLDPRSLIRAADTSDLAFTDISPLRKLDLLGPPSGWGKLDKVKDLAGVRAAHYPDLYYLSGHELMLAISNPRKVIESIRAISNGRVVCRTDCSSENVEKINLPRTHSVSPDKAVQFMKDTVGYLSRRGAKESEICFILHRFIPAAAASWALADPKSQIVRVDSLWGIPDGLQFLPHDTFEYDVKRGEISSQTIRYKISFIQETEDGSWKEIRIARRFGRSTSLAAPDVREVASQMHQLAMNLNQKIQVMWFCAIPESLHIGKNLPWFRMPAHIGKNLPWFRMPAPDLRISSPRTVGPMRPRFRIQTHSDLSRAESLPLDRYVLAVQPDVDLIRSDEFVRELANVAARIGAPVELYGSVLAHAYYMLNRAGVTVIAAGELQYSRVRGRQVFAKLVRDEIPQQIKQHGEVTVLARIDKQEARAALVVKLFEEAHELLKAERPEEVESELADLLEVVRSLASATGVSWEDVQAKADAKRSQRGGFDRGVVLLETAWPKASETKSQEDAIIPLRALGKRSEGDNAIEMNYASIFAKGAERTFKACDGTIYEVSLTGAGLRISRVGSEHEPPKQMKLPGFEKQ